VHRDNQLKAQFGAILKPNTNAQKMSFLSHFCTQLWAHLDADVTSHLRHISSHSRFDVTLPRFEFFFCSTSKSSN